METQIDRNFLKYMRQQRFIKMWAMTIETKSIYFRNLNYLFSQSKSIMAPHQILLSTLIIYCLNFQKKSRSINSINPSSFFNAVNSYTEGQGCFLTVYINDQNTLQMGSKSPELYSSQVPGQQQPKDSTKIYRNPDYLAYLSSTPRPGVRNMSQLLRLSFQKFGNKAFLGTIKNKSVNSHKGKTTSEKTVEYLTFADVQTRAKAIGSAILDLGLATVVQDKHGNYIKVIGVCSKNRAQWVIVDLGCILYGIADVAIYDTIGPDNLSQVIKDSMITTLFCSSEILAVASKSKNLGGLKKIICFDDVDSETLSKIMQKGIKCYTFKSLVELGKSRAYLHRPPIIVPTDCMTMICPSGTTGQVVGSTKLLMLSHLNFLACCSIIPTNKDLDISQKDTHFSYMPLAHVFERACVLWMAGCGGSVCFFSGDLMRLREDLQIAKPTIFISVPRLLNLIQQRTKKTFEEVQGCQKMILEKALNTKQKIHDKGEGFKHYFYDTLVFKKVKDIFGSRIRAIVSGSAPLATQVHSFLSITTGLPLLQGYGLSQTCGPTFMMHTTDSSVGHVGGPASNHQFKLVDIPQMGYTHSDLDHDGKPCPRGQVWIRGPSVFLGYFRLPQKTSQVKDSSGWLKTGDIGCLLPNGSLKIIDRKINLFKLQNGHYISPQRIQQIFLKKKLISEMFVYGGSMQTFIIAIIVPNKKAVQDIAHARNIPGEFVELCKNPIVKQEFLREHNSFGVSEGLTAIELPRNVYLESLTFLERGILTSTMKLQRFKAKMAYSEEIERMYKEGCIVKDQEGLSVTEIE